MDRFESTQPGRQDNPYPGPRPFEPSEKGRFFGRRKESSELAYLVAAHPTALLYAQSGVGKTSLLNAGITPIMKERGFDVLPLARVGSPSPPGVNRKRIANIFAFSAIASWLAQDRESSGEAARLRDWMLNASLAEGIKCIPPKTDDEGEPATRILIFDQFEEIFYAFAERWQERLNFFEQVASLLRSDKRVRILFAIREEYLAAFDAEAKSLPEAVRTRFRLERLRKPAALAALQEPLKSTAVHFEDGVAEVLVEDLLKVQVEDVRGHAISVLGEFVEPVQLQLVCKRLFDNIPVLNRAITTKDLSDFGNPDEALQHFYEQALVITTRETQVNEAQLRDWFGKQLITPALTRGMAFHGPTQTDGIPNDAIAVLEKHHLIRAEDRSGSRWYELTHDRFIRPILKSNADWFQHPHKRNLIDSILVSLAEASCRFGSALLEVARWDEAEKNLDQAVKIAKEAKDDRVLALALAYLGDRQFYNGQYIVARQQFKKALQVAIRSKSREPLALSRYNLARVDVVQGRSASAIPVLKKQIEEFGSLGLEMLSVESSIYLAKALLAVTKPADAQQELHRAIDRAQEFGFLLQQAHAHSLMGQVLEQAGDRNEATPHYRKAVGLFESVSKEPGASHILERADIKPLYLGARRIVSRHN